MLLTFADLVAKRESAWLTGVQTVLFGLESNSLDARACDFQGDTMTSWRSLFLFFSLKAPFLFPH